MDTRVHTLTYPVSSIFFTQPPLHHNKPQQVPCTYELTLSGPRYDSLGLWSSRNWDRCLPFPLSVIGTPDEKPLEREMEKQERKDAKQEKGEGVYGWPRVYFAGSTCADKTRWCVRALRGVGLV